MKDDKSILSVVGLFELLIFFTPGAFIYILFIFILDLDIKEEPYFILVSIIGIFVLGHINSQLSRYVEIFIGFFYNPEDRIRKRFIEDFNGHDIDSIVQYTSGFLSKKIMNMDRLEPLKHLDMHQRNSIFSRNMILPSILYLFIVPFFNIPLYVSLLIILCVTVLFVARYVRHKMKYLSDVYQFSFLCRDVNDHKV